jgi:signal transduction histidine kinase/CheY-like chemotaxis protein
MSYWIGLAIFFLVAVSGVTLRFARVLGKARTSVATLESRLETVQDEIWELKSAAEALDRAEAANEAKSRFLATVSHEFRTPLNGILGMADLLASTPLNAEQTSYLSAIRASGDALSSLINEILDFSRIEAGKLDLKESEFDLAALVEGVVELLSPRAQGKGLEICSFIQHDTPCLVVGDAGRLRQVLLNLIGNAVKFTESGGVGVEVSPSAGGTLRFSVFDTGPGVPDSRRNAIFQEFEQADGSPTRQYEGTGLGLAISRRIIEHIGGKLWLVDTGQRGSHFCFEISLKQPDSHKRAPRKASQMQGQRVLIVANSPFGPAYLARRLSDFGVKTYVASSLEQATSIINDLGKETLDTMVVDCALGEETTQELSDLARRSGCSKSLLLFSPFERRAFGDAMLKNFDGWLVKPLRLESVETKLIFSKLDVSVGQKPEELAIAAPLAGRRILLAEDNDVNALLVERQLRKIGAAVHRARDGLEAVALVQDSFTGKTPPFDAVLMDVRMPGLDGLSAARKIRANEVVYARAPLKIIALTANAFDDDRIAAYSAGMQGFLTKPLDLKQLIDAVAEGPPRFANVSSSLS